MCGRFIHSLCCGCFCFLLPEYSSIHYYPTCSCAQDKSGYQCSSTDYRKPPSWRIITQDWLVNITGQHTEDYLLYTTYDKRLHRYALVHHLWQVSSLVHPCTPPVTSVFIGTLLYTTCDKCLIGTPLYTTCDKCLHWYTLVHHLWQLSP